MNLNIQDPLNPQDDLDARLLEKSKDARILNAKRVEKERV